MSKPLRVLQVFAQMNRGGAETMIMNLYRNIDRSKVQFDFIVHTEEKCVFDDEILALGGSIYRVPRYTAKNHFHYVQTWSNFFREHKEYKIIHGHVRSTAAIYLKIANNYGLHTIAHSHSTSSGSGFPSIVKNILQFPIRYTANYLFTCSMGAGEWLYGKKACSDDNFFILKNAIEVEKFIFNKETRSRIRKELGIEDKFVIGHIGRFSTPKNHTFLIDVFREVLNRNNNSVLILIGDGELKSVIEKKVLELGLSENVIFMGLRSDVPELLQVMDVFLFPSLYEGLPVTLVEAQATGLPSVISSNITDEIKVTNLVNKISLNESLDHWAEKVLSFNGTYIRESAINNITESGYNIAQVSEWYQNFIFDIRDKNKSHLL